MSFPRTSAMISERFSLDTESTRPMPYPFSTLNKGHLSATYFSAASRMTQVTSRVVIEVESAAKPCCVAEWIVRYHQRAGGLA